jgi:hypothetical protein
MFIGLVIAGKSSDILYKKLTERNHEVGEPEFRLPPMTVSSPLIVVAFFWYRWSVEVKTHLILLIIGTTFFRLGLVSCAFSPKP